MLKERIQQDLKDALKKKQELLVSVLRLVITVFYNKEIEKKTKLREENGLSEEEITKQGQLTDEEITNIISSEIKKRKDAISIFEKGQRQDLAEKEKKEIEILQKYLPEQLSDEQIKKLAKEIIEKVGAKEIKDMGKVMAELIPKIKGRAEGGKVSQIVKELLTPKTD